MIVRGIRPGQIMSTHAFFFSDLMLQAIISFVFLRTLILFRIKIIQAKKNGYKNKKKMRNNKKWRHHWRQINGRCKRWSSVPVIKVLTNGMLVILKKIESYDVRSDEKWRRNHWYLVVNRVKSHDHGKEGHFVRLLRRSVDIIKSTPIFKVPQKLNNFLLWMN